MPSRSRFSSRPQSNFFASLGQGIQMTPEEEEELRLLIEEQQREQELYDRESEEELRLLFEDQDRIERERQQFPFLNLGTDHADVTDRQGYADAIDAANRGASKLLRPTLGLPFTSLTDEQTLDVLREAQEIGETPVPGVRDFNKMLGEAAERAAKHTYLTGPRGVPPIPVGKMIAPVVGGAVEMFSPAPETVSEIPFAAMDFTAVGMAMAASPTIIRMLRRLGLDFVDASDEIIERAYRENRTAAIQGAETSDLQARQNELDAQTADALDETGDIPDALAEEFGQVETELRNRGAQRFQGPSDHDQSTVGLSGASNEQLVGRRNAIETEMRALDERNATEGLTPTLRERREHLRVENMRIQDEFIRRAEHGSNDATLWDRLTEISRIFNRTGGAGDEADRLTSEYDAIAQELARREGAGNTRGIIERAQELSREGIDRATGRNIIPAFEDSGPISEMSYGGLDRRLSELDELYDPNGPADEGLQRLRGEVMAELNRRDEQIVRQETEVYRSVGSLDEQRKRYERLAQMYADRAADGGQGQFSVLSRRMQMLFEMDTEDLINRSFAMGGQERPLPEIAATAELLRRARNGDGAAADALVGSRENSLSLHWSRDQINDWIIENPTGSSATTEEVAGYIQRRHPRREAGDRARQQAQEDQGATGTQALTGDLSSAPNSQLLARLEEIERISQNPAQANIPIVRINDEYEAILNEIADRRRAGDIDLEGLEDVQSAIDDISPDARLERLRNERRGRRDEIHDEIRSIKRGIRGIDADIAARQQQTGSDIDLEGPDPIYVQRHPDAPFRDPDIPRLPIPSTSPVDISEHVRAARQQQTGSLEARRASLQMRMNNLLEEMDEWEDPEFASRSTLREKLGPEQFERYKSIVGDDAEQVHDNAQRRYNQMEASGENAAIRRQAEEALEKARAATTPQEAAMYDRQFNTIMAQIPEVPDYSNLVLRPREDQSRKHLGLVKEAEQLEELEALQDQAIRAGNEVEAKRLEDELQRGWIEFYDNQDRRRRLERERRFAEDPAAEMEYGYDPDNLRFHRMLPGGDPAVPAQLAEVKEQALKRERDALISDIAKATKYRDIAHAAENNEWEGLQRMHDDYRRQLDKLQQDRDIQIADDERMRATESSGGRDLTHQADRGLAIDKVESQIEEVEGLINELDAVLMRDTAPSEDLGRWNSAIGQLERQRDDLDERIRFQTEEVNRLSEQGESETTGRIEMFANMGRATSEDPDRMTVPELLNRADAGDARVQDELSARNITNYVANDREETYRRMNNETLWTSFNDTRNIDHRALSERNPDLVDQISEIIIEDLDLMEHQILGRMRDNDAPDYFDDLIDETRGIDPETVFSVDELYGMDAEKLLEELAEILGKRNAFEKMKAEGIMSRLEAEEFAIETDELDSALEDWQGVGYSTQGGARNYVTNEIDYLVLENEQDLINRMGNLLDNETLEGRHEWNRIVWEFERRDLDVPSRERVIDEYIIDDPNQTDLFGDIGRAVDDVQVPEGGGAADRGNVFRDEAGQHVRPYQNLTDERVTEEIEDVHRSGDIRRMGQSLLDMEIEAYHRNLPVLSTGRRNEIAQRLGLDPDPTDAENFAQQTVRSTDEERAAAIESLNRQQQQSGEFTNIGEEEIRAEVVRRRVQERDQGNVPSDFEGGIMGSIRRDIARAVENNDRAELQRMRDAYDQQLDDIIERRGEYANIDDAENARTQELVNTLMRDLDNALAQLTSRHPPVLSGYLGEVQEAIDSLVEIRDINRFADEYLTELQGLESAWGSALRHAESVQESIRREGRLPTAEETEQLQNVINRTATARIAHSERAREVLDRTEGRSQRGQGVPDQGGGESFQEANPQLEVERLRNLIENEVNEQARTEMIAEHNRLIREHNLTRNPIFHDLTERTGELPGEGGIMGSIRRDIARAVQNNDRAELQRMRNAYHQQYVDSVAGLRGRYSELRQLITELDRALDQDTQRRRVEAFEQSQAEPDAPDQGNVPSDDVNRYTPESSVADETSYMDDWGYSVDDHFTADGLSDMDEIEVVSIVREMRELRELTPEEHRAIINDLRRRVDEGEMNEVGMNTYLQEMGID